MRQTQALRVMMAGANVFLTGAPGSGKTFLLNEFIGRSQRAGKKVAVTASTGIAASHLGGTTIHSWSGLGIADYLSKEDLKRLSANSVLQKRYNQVDILVIDEISMLHGYQLDNINALAKLCRASSQAFGGIQVVLVGDFFQLPPVSVNASSAAFVFLSQAWSELSPEICYLSEQHRQSDRDNLLLFLEAMRSGDLTEEHYGLIHERLKPNAGDDDAITRLYTHNIDVDAINQRRLQGLSAKSVTFTMEKKGSKAKLEQLARSLLVPEELELKIGAEVMFVANNFSSGYVNGSRGQIVAFENGLPVVSLLNKKHIRVDLHTWTLSEDGRIRAEIAQVPLRLAWAITIHKSQGMSLDAARIDLSRAFTPGMGYVALSRVRSLAGLHLTGLNSMALSMLPEIYELDQQMRMTSDQLARNTPDIEAEVAPVDQPQQSVPANVDMQLLAKLKSWRLARSRLDKLPPYFIAHNATLEAIAASKQPLNEQQLLAIPGLSVGKRDKYGADLLAIMAGHYI